MTEYCSVVNLFYSKYTPIIDFLKYNIHVQPEASYSR